MNAELPARMEAADPTPAIARDAGVRTWLAAAALAVAIAALYVGGSAVFPLSDPDEARYAEIGREMLRAGDWITPHLNYVEYFEKPPLVYWATAAALAVFGVNELAARLPVVLSGLATLAIVVWLAARMYGRTTAVLALAILALSPLFGLLAQVLTLDMSLTLFMTAALAAVWRGWSGPADASRPWYRLAYVATAAAVLVKGPVAVVLVAGIAGPFLLLQGGWRALRPALDWRAAALATALALPWFLLVSWRHPEFVRFFVVDQHLARYLWTTEHGQPFWFYLPFLPVVFGPWSIALLCDPAALGAVRAPRDWSSATRFLAWWAAAIVLFFSLSASKLATYILPALPPLAILTARAWQLAIAHGRTAGLARVGWLFLLLAPLAGLTAVVLPIAHPHWRMPLIAPVLLAGAAALFATGVAIRRCCARGRPLAAFAALTAGWFAVLAIALGGRRAANEYRILGVTARAAMRPDDRLAIYGSYVEGIPFYAERRAIMIVGRGELTFGSEHGDQAAFFWPSASDLQREWSAPGRLFLVAKPPDLAQLTPPLDPPPIVLATKNDKVLVVNRAP